MTRLSLGPDMMISLAPMEYCVIKNPVLRNTEGKVIVSKDGQVKLKMGDRNFRYHQQPFPLYPGELLEDKVQQLPVVSANQALRLRAVSAFEDSGIDRTPGEEWLFEGPGIYRPRKEVEILPIVEAFMIVLNKALRLRATRDCVDRLGNKRKCGDEWFVKTPGSYLPTAYEECVAIVVPYQLNEKLALQVKALRDHVDQFGKQRKFGQEWLVTYKETEAYMCDIDEEAIQLINVTTLTAQQYCIISSPVNNEGVAQLTEKKLIRGETSFFLQPGEYLSQEVSEVLTLDPDEGIVLRANRKLHDGEVYRNPGERWLVRGPCEFVPPIDVEIVDRRRLIPLGECEGIYVQNIDTGHVRSVIGMSYMPNENEIFWHKPMSQQLKSLLALQNPVDSIRRNLIQDIQQCSSVERKSSDGDSHCPVVTLQVPHKAAVQIYDFVKDVARVEFGPTLVMLEPNEEITVLSLSGRTPKRPHVIKSLYLLLGPDYCTDVVVVETADHARLSIKLSYNWHFDVSSNDPPEEAAKIFSVADFVGDVCKLMASRIRSAVAVSTFDKFHKFSARIIRAACLGLDASKRVNNRIQFDQNRLVITAVDIQSVEPVDDYTRESLQKSVKLAIEITTQSQEAEARHEAERIEQEARGKLDRQKIADQAGAEHSRIKLVESQLAAKSVDLTGKAKSKAMATTERLRIKAQAKVEEAKQKAEQKRILLDAKLKAKEQFGTIKLEYLEREHQLELKQRETLSKMQTSRFEQMVASLGSQTLGAMATAGSSHEIKMLQALGLKSTLITDGSTPVNLVTTANGLIGGNPAQQQALATVTGLNS